MEHLLAAGSVLSSLLFPLPLSPRLSLPFSFKEQDASPSLRPSVATVVDLIRLGEVKQSKATVAIS